MATPRWWQWEEDRQRATSRYLHHNGRKWFDMQAPPGLSTIEMETRTEHDFRISIRMGEMFITMNGVEPVGLSLRIEDGYAVE